MSNRTVKIVTFVPKESADTVRQALGDVGAGIIGEYSYCSFSVVGKGRFNPSKDANPTVGSSQTLNVVEEERIEVVCSREKAKNAIAAMKAAHPYEEVAFDLYPLLSEDEL